MRTYYRVSEAAKLIGVSASALRSYTAQGKIKDTRNPAGQRTYTLEAINAFLGIEQQGSEGFVFYVRSSDGDKTKMDNQISLLKEKFGEPLKTYNDKASGLNEKRPGLKSLLNAASKGNFDTVYITQKDRLTRFGYTYLEELLNAYGVKIVVLGDAKEKTFKEELLQDFMSLLASFSGKFYGLRGYEQSKQLLVKAGEKLEETH